MLDLFEKSIFFIICIIPLVNLLYYVYIIFKPNSWFYNLKQDKDLKLQDLKVSISFGNSTDVFTFIL